MIKQQLYFCLTNVNIKKLFLYHIWIKIISFSVVSSIKRLKDKSEKDEAEIKKYIEKSKSDAEKYTKICEELGVLKSTKNEQIAAFKKNFYTIFFLVLILVLIIIVFGLSI